MDEERSYSVQEDMVSAKAITVIENAPSQVFTWEKVSGKPGEGAGRNGRGGDGGRSKNYCS